jgi:hypothetical protein
VDPRGLEPLTSAMRGRRDSFPEVFRACKTAANHRISALALFSTFQEIYSGRCTDVRAYIRTRSGIIVI